MSNKNAETLVREMLDREAIRELAARYAHYVWQGDIEGYLGLYADDGVFRSADPDWETVVSRSELHSSFEGMMEREKPRPFMHNHVIDLLGPDKARGTCYTEVRLSIRGENGLLVGFYEDQYSKVDGAWKFKERKLVVEYFGPTDDYRVPPDVAAVSQFE